MGLKHQPYDPKSDPNWFLYRVMHPKDTDGIANNEDPHQNAPDIHVCLKSLDLYGRWCLKMHWFCTLFKFWDNYSNYFKVAEFVRSLRYERLYLFLGLQLFSSPDSTNTQFQHNNILPTRNRWFYMSVHVLLNLLNELGKKIRCEALPRQV